MLLTAASRCMNHDIQCAATLTIFIHMSASTGQNRALANVSMQQPLALPNARPMQPVHQQYPPLPVHNPLPTMPGTGMPGGMWQQQQHSGVSQAQMMHPGGGSPSRPTLRPAPLCD